ncbi:MAG: S4 domain-containing protein, partial [Acidobacteriota bacterium]
FYQFWLNVADADVIRYLKYFTWLDADEIGELETRLAEAPQARDAHRRLAREITRMNHGESALALAEKSSEVLFGGEIGDLEADDVLDIFGDVPSTDVSADLLAGEGASAVDLFVASGLAPSKGQARRLLRDGGAYVNNVRVADEQARFTRDSFKGGRVLVLRKGRKSYHLLQVEEA